MAFHSIGLSNSISAAESRLYSRMKYGDPIASQAIANRMVELLLESGRLELLCEGRKELCLAASAYGLLPTAARSVLNMMIPAIEHAGWRVQLVRFVRRGGFGASDYGKMNFKERQAAMSTREIGFGAGSAELIADKPLLVFDDLRSTGLHESALYSLLQSKGLGERCLFSYWIAFDPDLSLSHPAREEKFNAAAVANLQDLAKLFNGLSTAPLTNSRIVKFVLSGGMHGREDVGAFLETISLSTARDLYRAACMGDGYSKFQRFQRGFKTLQDHLQPQLT